MTRTKTNLGERAIVLGGSVSGMCCAKVLSSHFDEVVILERDAMPAAEAEPTFRPGVSQSRHHHVLLARGRENLSSLFPGFDESLAEAGAPLLDYARDCALFSPIGGAPRFESGIGIRPCRRQLVDWAIRRHLREVSNVRWIDKARVSGLAFSEGERAVQGVRFQLGSVERFLSSDLVVDATGKNTKLPKWLKELDLSVPEEEVIDPKMGYASRLFKPGTDFSADWRATEVAAQAPQNPRAAGLWEVENGQWLLTLIGINGTYPPTDEEGFVQFANELPNNLVADFLSTAEPISPIYGHRGSKTRRRDYGKMKSFPDGLVATGDAVCSFNPIYGQGMTMASQGALELDTVLKQRASKGLKGLAKVYHRRLKRAGLSAWLLATSEDFRWDATTGGEPDLLTRISYRYLDWLMPISPYSKEVVGAFLGIANMVTPSYALFSPTILLQRLVHPIRQKLQPELLTGHLYREELGGDVT
ncbi:MAG: 2-polyprenyl-6-methoxyphenol hydroxylase-like oxidoreductase [Myxococcota bacterium]|nr:2-polyprenyl-6-methoxyphenol hydroxylase-like oxidoreductase [Myxococcota bacterium]